MVTSCVLKLHYIIFLNFSRLSRTQSVLLTHGDSVERVGDKLKVGGWSSNRIVTVIYNENLRIYGLQFHPEVSNRLCMCFEKMTDDLYFIQLIGGSYNQWEANFFQFFV